MMVIKGIDQLVRQFDRQIQESVENTLPKMVSFFNSTSPRFYCPLSPAFGHLSNTIAILKQFIALGFMTKGEIVYQNEEVLKKLRILLPQIKQTDPPPPIVVTSGGNAAGITLTLQPTEPLKDPEKFAITGGWEETEKVAGMTVLLNVDFMLVLQPYTWEVEHPQVKDVAYFIKAKNPQEVSIAQQIKEFDYMLYYRPQPQISENEWAEMAKLPGLEIKIPAAKAIVDTVTKTDRLFCPVYGISNEGVKTASTGPPPGATLFNLSAAIRYRQANGPDYFQRGAVILVLTPITETSWNILKQNVKGERLYSPPWTLTEFIKDYMYPSEQEKVLVRNNLNNADDITKAIQELHDGQVLILNLFDLPMDVFDLYYSMASLPSVFEGAGTATMVMTLKKPYFRLAHVPYPVLPLLPAQPSAESLEASTAAKILPTQLSKWSEVVKETPGFMLGEFILKCYQNESPMQMYFSQFGFYLENKVNDKLFSALLLLFNCRQFAETYSQIQMLAVAGETSGDPVLDKLYQDLMNNLSDGTLNLVPGAFPEGPIADFYKGICADSQFLITEAEITPPAAGRILVTGITNSLLGIPRLSVKLVFTNGELGLTSSLETYREDLSWNFLNVPWFSLKSPNFMIVQANNDAATTGAVGSSIQISGTLVDVTMNLPIVAGRWVFLASFSGTQPSISSFFQLVGGINLTQLLPPPLSTFADLAVQRCEIMYDSVANSIGYFSLTVGTTRPWPLFGKIILSGLVIQTTVSNPGDLKLQATRFNITASFPIGPGSVQVDVVVPGLAFSGRLVEPSDPSKSVTIGDVVSLFLPPGQTVPISGDINEFSFNYNQPQQSWGVSCGVLAEWQVPPPPQSPWFTIVELGFQIDGSATETTGIFTGSVIILPDSANFGLSLLASYGGSAAGWTFEGKQTSGRVPLGELLTYYLGSAWLPAPGANYDIDGLGLTITTGNNNSYVFTGKTAAPWVVPFIPQITVSASLRAGYIGGSSSPPPLSAEDVSALALALPGDANQVKGPFARLETEWSWNNSVPLKVWFDYNPQVKSFGITWGFLQGTVAQDPKQNNDWIGALTFTDNVTIGYLVETMVSWITGSKFGLEAPWSFLNGIKLSNLALVYNFTKNTVSFKFKIGPINLGFASIESIDVVYQTNQPKPEDNGVMVTLTGSFPWNIGNDAVGNTNSLGPWDTSKPATAPAPPGNGNKYLDLRLLAMGQHVTMECFRTADTVQKAIACMATMPDPKPGELPPVQFDARSAWLIGADFGILKLQAPTPPPAGSTALVPSGSVAGAAPGYFLTLQIVFNDPVIYALRIALDGEPAKIFKGLDFQIMYRQVSSTVGVYQAEITLPDVMRRLSVGAYTIILPVFGIAIYTNGDFQVDLGFPWNEDFSRSFTIEAIIYPGIPVLGSAGLYFGKLSSATTTKVPAATNGTFNPVIVFGFGMQVGFGKSIEYGILKAGFSLTVVGILEGVIAKWNPYQLTDGGGGSNSQVQGAYYFWLRGTFGIIGKLYGSIDFAIVKADVSITIKLLLQLTYESYVSISMTVIASVDVSVSIKINLGLFSIKISFSFSMRLKETFTIENKGTPPWQVPATPAQSVLRASSDVRLRAIREPLALVALAGIAPNWSNLLPPASPAALSGYLAPALTVARDEWQAASQNPADQLPCYVAMLFIDSVPPASEDASTSLLKAAGAASDTSFEFVAKMILRWAIAAIQSQPKTAGEVDDLVIKDTDLILLLDNVLTSTDQNPTPIPVSAIESFMSGQFRLTVQLPDANDVNVTYFPVASALKLNIPKYGDAYPGYSYTFSDYNSIDTAALSALRAYFDQLAVQVESEMSRQSKAEAVELDAQSLSMANWILGDYFLLIARQMIQAARDALRDFKYPLESPQTANQIVHWINTTGELTGNEVYTLYDLFAANPTHSLTANKDLRICGATYQALASDTFNSIAALPLYGGGFTATQLAAQPDNAANRNLLQPGAKITYRAKADYIVQPLDSLESIGAQLGVTLSELLSNSNVLSFAGLLAPVAWLQIPPFNYKTQSGDTLQAITARFAVTLQDLAGDATDSVSCANNGDIPDLFDAASNPNLDVPHLAQFQVKELIAEAQRSLAIQHLSGMASRYYLHGLRLPTNGVAPKQKGMWVKDDGGTLKLPPHAGLFALTGQQFPLPDIQGTANFQIILDRSNGPDWLLFQKNGAPTNQLTIEIAPGSTDALRIQKVTAYARANRLATGLRRLGAERMYESDLASYSFTTMLMWQSANLVHLPYGTPPGGVPALRLWKLPDILVNLPDPKTRAINPKFSVRVGRYDEATGGMINTPVSYYGWASIIAFTVKRVPPILSSPTTETTYEIVGAGDNDIVLMERLLEQVKGDNAFLDQLILGYQPNQTGDAMQGVQTDPVDSVTMGIEQVNLSTETRPPTGFTSALVKDEAAAGLGLLNKPSDFIRLLWEASITRNGGFYLYYYNAAAGTGLPERVFNDKGETSLSLIVLYAKPSSEIQQNRLTDFMNAVATGESIDTSNSVVFAQAAPPDPPVKIDASITGSLSSMAYAYYTNVGDLAQANANLTLAQGKKLIVSEGVYEVPPTGVQPGGSLSSIAAYFGTTVEAIKAANLRQTKWPDPLPLYTAIWLPKIEVTLGTSAGGNTLAGIGDYYGENLTSLAAHNQFVEGIFGVGQKVIITAGPSVRNATVPPGVEAVAAARPVPPEVPGDPNDPNFAKDFLLNAYSLLNYQIAENVDFNSSNMGLPAGPATVPADPENYDKIRAPKTLTTDDDWDYSQAMPYPKFAKTLLTSTANLPDPNQNPYIGVGFLLQMDFAWQDLYGNTLVTVLSDPHAGDPEPLNQSPMPTGYTDALTSLAQWPAISTGWQVLKGTGGGKAQLVLRLSFDPSQYQPSQTETWRENAGKDLRVYTQLFYQLTDPNGIAYTIEATLLKGEGSNPGIVRLSGSQVSRLLNWLFYGDKQNGTTSIYEFLYDRANGGTTVPSPPAESLINTDIESANLNTNQIFELALSLVIERTGGTVLGDLETTPGIKQAATSVAPLSQDLNPDSKTLGLTKFAQNFQDALSQPGSYLMKVATGVDRSKISTIKNGNAVWSVRLGLTTSEGISYAITNPNDPAIFAPQPISNQLQNRNQVPIYDYRTGQGINWTKPDRLLDLIGIDMDVWGGQFFGAIDGVLSPEFIAATQIVGAHQGIDYLQQILDQKKALAKIVKLWMIPIYQGEVADPRNAQEAFYQQLLERLSNAYTTRAAIQFEASVNADIDGPPATKPPRLFGNVLQNQMTGTLSQINEPKSEITLTSPKLELKTSADEPLAFLLTAPDTVKGGDGQVLPNLTLDLSYNGFAVEHQIATVHPIDGYEASSWLSFVIADQPGPLDAYLGRFMVPLLLRAYPTTPTMAAQTGGATYPDAEALSQITRWDYSFTYSLPFHYPQDRVHCEVDFNIADALKAQAGLLDAFNQLAEFITVFPEVNKDLEGILATIDATTDDQVRINNAAIALASFIQMLKAVTGVAQGSGLIMPLYSKQFASAGAPPYVFSIQEGSAMIDSTEALLVTIHGQPPEGMGTPLVLVDPLDYEVQSYSGTCEGDYCYWFKSKSDGTPLRAADGQIIADREVVLTEMDILQRQDAWSTVYIKRNEELVIGKPTASPFVYTTPNVQFANPLHPTINANRVFHIAEIGSPDGKPVHRTLDAHLTALFDALLRDNTQQYVTFQVVCSYEYPINQDLQSVPLPVLMQPPIKVDVKNQEGVDRTLLEMIASWTSAIELWFDTHKPQLDNGTLWFDLYIMSNLTEQPMPLLRLRELELQVKYID